MTQQATVSLMNYKTSAQTVEEQRTQERRRTTGAEAMIFTPCRQSLSPVLEDASAGGAGLLLCPHHDVIKPNTRLTLIVQTGQQRLTRQAIVRWIKTRDDETRFGVEYIDHVGLDPKTHKLDIGTVRIDPACALRLPANIAVRRKVLPFLEKDGVMHIAAGAPNNMTMTGAVERMVKMPVVFWQAEPEPLERILQQVYGSATAVKTLPVGGAAQPGNDAVDLGDKLLYAAYIRQASDIHIDPGYNGARIRFRVDGQLETYDMVKHSIYTELASRLKVMASLDIAEKRLPQDGRFSHQFVSGGRRVDVRVATLPTKYGERITMRLLALQTGELTLNKLGFIYEHRTLIEKFLRRTQGMMILTGPTGSGKTTTLYAAIRMLLEERDVNIITIEDPIEYEIEGVAQCEVDPTSNKVDFAKALRSILRHDPDVVMLGEIRDQETANIAIKAALTGHMVLGTLHTNSAAATVTRLIDMGVEPYLVAAALRLAVAQRLLRRLCKHCRIIRPLTEAEAIALGRIDLAGRSVYEPTGCVYCGNRGYSGRIGLYELLELRADWARDITEGGGEAKLIDNMRESGMYSLLDDAIDKLLSGETSYSEVLQIASSW
ncbi:MAG: Flp pilus assembly complex ATPase component TadA [Methylomicrobium sp.]|nr:Flp pilus assembly complex ATPase component TadA [Methylomicrobium sp.]